MSGNVRHGGNLSSAQQRAIEALATGATTAQAAVAASRTERTLRRWLVEDPEYQRALQKAQNAAVSDAARRMAGLLDKSITALEKILDKPGVSERDRLRAINLVNSHAMRLTEFADLQRQVDQLETIVNELVNQKS